MHMPAFKEGRAITEGASPKVNADADQEKTTNMLVFEAHTLLYHSA